MKSNTQLPEDKVSDTDLMLFLIFTGYFSVNNQSFFKRFGKDTTVFCIPLTFD